MQYFIKGFVAAAFVAVLASAPAAPVWANAYDDFKVATAAMTAGKLDEAIRLFTRVIESGEFSGKNLGLAYNNRGWVYNAKRQHDRAIADLTRALSLQPNNKYAYNSRGIAYGKKGQYDRAIADYNKATKIDPNFGPAYSNRGVAHEKLGRKDLAIADYRKAARLLPKHPGPRQALKRLGAKP